MTGAEFKAYREKLGLTQRELADLLNPALDRNYGTGQLSVWETGKRKVPEGPAAYLESLVMANSSSLFAPDPTPAPEPEPSSSGDTAPPLPHGQEQFGPMPQLPVRGGMYAKVCEELWGMIALLVSSMGAVTGSPVLITDGQIIDADKQALGAAWGKLAETNETFRRMLTSATTSGAWIEVALVSGVTANKILANHRPIEGTAVRLHPVPDQQPEPEQPATFVAP